MVDEDASFKAILISDITANNITSLKNIVVQAGEVGITLRLAANASKDWRPGAVFEIKAKGAKVGRYQDGSLQIDYTGLNDAASMVTPPGEVATITPKALTFADIYSGKYDNILVAVDGAQFKETGKELNPNKAVRRPLALTSIRSQTVLPRLQRGCRSSRSLFHTMRRSRRHLLLIRMVVSSVFSSAR